MLKTHDPQKHRYDLSQFPLATLLRDAVAVEGVSLLDADSASNAELIKTAKANFNQLRSNAMEVLQSSSFQTQLARFSETLAKTHFSGDCYFQKMPSIRLFMPGALGTSWHTDNWYGHAAQSVTFWVPLTPVPQGAGVQFVHNCEVLKELESGLGRSNGLADINRICQQHATEVTAQPGEYLSFNARTLHGSVENSTGHFRCSIDFRGTLLTDGVGNKPLNNYRIIEQGTAREAVKQFATRSSVKYINGATGASTKYQHILLEAYAAEQGLSIVRNEAEIESVAARPVLCAYANRDVPSPDNFDHLLVYSMQCLPADRKTSQSLLENCARRGIAIHFALEDAIFPTTADIAACLQPNQTSVA